MKIYNGNNLVGEVKELTKENFNKYFSTNFTEYKNNCGYNIGDYVVYGGSLYKCIKAITVSEEFNPSKWEKVYGSDNISSLKIENDKLYITFESGESKEIENFSLTNALNQQVEYGQFGFDNTIEQVSTLDTLIPFKTKVGNIDLNSDGTITLKANKTYKLSCYFRITDTDTLKALSIKQNEKFLFNVVAQASEITETCTSVYIFTPTENAKVGLYTPSISIQLPTLTSVGFYNNTKLIVEEIAQPVINNANNTYKETVLYDGFASSGTIQLSDNVKNYDYIDIYGCTSGSPKKSLGGYAQKTRVRVDEIDTFRSYCLGGTEVAYVINCFLTTSWNYYIKIQCFDTDTSLLINQTNSLGWGTCGVYKVIGIKY